MHTVLRIDEPAGRRGLERGECGAGGREPPHSAGLIPPRAQSVRG